MAGLLGLLVPLMGAAAGFAATRQLDVDPVSVLVTASSDFSGARVTLAFSRPVDYRLRESRARLRLILDDPVAETSRVDQRLSSDVLRRIRFDKTRRGTEIVFYLGRGFDNFGLSELHDPFRVVLMFHSGSALPAIPPAGTEPGLPEGSGVAPGFPEDVPLLPEPRRSKRPGEIRTIVIDPGHGGEEEGAVSAGGLKEKELVLDLARRLRSRLRDAGYRVALTREIDQALDLSARTALANHMQADLFLSIHANSSIRTGVRGAETYFVSYGASDEEAMSLARKEGGLPGADPGGGIQLVLWEMAQAAHLTNSSRLAELIQSEMNTLAGTADRGVKQAPFRVLVGAAMPAVLVEVGFLSNPDEEKLLVSSRYRERIAEALGAAVDRFAREMLLQAGSTRPAGPGGGSP